MRDERLDQLAARAARRPSANNFIDFLNNCVAAQMIAIAGIRQQVGAVYQTSEPMPMIFSEAIDQDLAIRRRISIAGAGSRMTIAEPRQRAPFHRGEDHAVDRWNANVQHRDLDPAADSRAPAFDPL